MPLSAGAAAYKLAYEISPITLIGGIAGDIPGAGIPLLSLLQSLNFGGLLGNGGLDDMEQAFAHFMPIPGSTLLDYQVGTYPFANMTIAANCVIRQPSVISMLMRVPMRNTYTADVKNALMQMMQSTLVQHIQSGGWFDVSTPSFYYDSVLLLKISDASSGQSNQTQVEYRFDFYKPLISMQDALETESAYMSLLSSGGATDGALSGVAPTVGAGGNDGAALQPNAGSVQSTPGSFTGQAPGTVGDFNYQPGSAAV